MAEERYTNTPPATALDLNVRAQIEKDKYTDPLRRTVALQCAPRLGGRIMSDFQRASERVTKLAKIKIEECT
jgi:hypothetical protein